MSTTAALSAPLAQLSRERLPRHIAIIMDGNGRWAQQRGLPRVEGHRRGAEVARRTTETCARLGIEQLTLYCLSSENWKRPAEELDFLMQLLRHYMIETRPEVMQNNVRVAVIGRRDGISPAALREIDTTLEMTSGNTGLRLCLAINYGGRGELTDACRQIAASVAAGRLAFEEIDEQLVDQSLYTAGMPEPDLLIRTAGEMRISNFLLWQISYAEIWVTERCWPDFDDGQLHAALCDFARRDRRFGGLGPR
jgi:undecaprenyl diphosphate synthase